MNTFFLLAFIILFLDLLYYQFTKDIYIDKIEEIQQREFKFRPEGAIIRYICIFFGLYYFILHKNLSIQDAFLYGIIYGGLFNGTMYASFQKWNAIGALLDTLWLSILFSFTTYIIYKYN